MRPLKELGKSYYTYYKSLVLILSNKDVENVLIVSAIE